jgi:hypothetical protein
VSIFGANIVASEGEEWKKYRKVAAPAFSEVCLENHSSSNPEHPCQKNNKLVWDETIQIMMDLFNDVWGDRSEVVVDHCVDITLPVRFLWPRLYQMSQYLHQIALFVIGVAGS